MKLEAKQVQFISPFLTSGFQQGVPRFYGKEKTVHMRETAFVIEGQALKVSFPLVDLFVRKALSDSTSLTIPYQRIEKAQLVRWPLSRLIFLVILILSPLVMIYLSITIPFNRASGDLLTLWYMVLISAIIISLYCVIRIRARFMIVFRNKADRRRQLFLRIKPKKLSKQFEDEMKRFLSAATAGVPGGNAAPESSS